MIVDRQIDRQIGMQMNLHDVLASLANRTVRQTYFCTLNLMTRLADALGDIGRAD